MKKYILITFLLFVLHASAQTLDRAAIHRIGDYGKLWCVLKLFHPQMAYGHINEDSLFVDNIDELLKHPSAENFKDAVAKMLNRLHDPYTAIEDTAKNMGDSVALPNRTLLQWRDDSIASVYFDDTFIQQNANENGTDSSFLRLLDTLRNARAVIIDLRKTSNKNAAGEYYRFVEKLFSYVTENNVNYPSFRSRIHYGHESDTFDIGFYYQGWVLRNSPVLKRRQTSVHKPVCLLINRFNANISYAIAAMQQDDNALVIADDSIGNKFEPSWTYPMQLTDNIKVNIRTTETVYRKGITFYPDITMHRIGSAPNDSLMSVAFKSLLNKNRFTQTPGESLPNLFAKKKVEGYDSLTYPPAPLRLLGLMRYWSAIAYFCPNKDKITKNWDSVLYEYVPELLQVKDSLEYTWTVRKLVTEIHDGHGFFSSSLWDKMVYGIPELDVKYVEHKTIVYKIYNDSLKKIFSPGDEIIKLDNVAVNKVRDWFAQHVGASNNAALQQYVSWELLSGTDGSPITITFLHEGAIKNVVLKRNIHNFSENAEGPAWKKINAKTGYVDFGRLQVSQIDSMFNDLKNTDAIILDDRSYPQGTVWTLINYLTDKPVVSAKGTTMIADSPDPLNVATAQDVLWTIPVTPTAIQYKGKIIILVNETTLSQAEYSCMVLQAAYKKVTIIGSQTAGADGDVTHILIPGGIHTAFSGHGIHYPDGRPTQGIGIVPDIKISPTIKGIKEDRDEVLERAILFAKTGK